MNRLIYAATLAATLVACSKDALAPKQISVFYANPSTHTTPSVTLRAEVEDYVYSYQGYHQQDFSLSVGLSIASQIGSATTP